MSIEAYRFEKNSDKIRGYLRSILPTCFGDGAKPNGLEDLIAPSRLIENFTQAGDILLVGSKPQGMQLTDLGSAAIRLYENKQYNTTILTVGEGDERHLPRIFLKWDFVDGNEASFFYINVIGGMHASILFDGTVLIHRDVPKVPSLALNTRSRTFEWDLAQIDSKRRIRIIDVEISDAMAGLVLESSFGMSKRLVLPIVIPPPFI